MTPSYRYSKAAIPEEWTKNPALFGIDPLALEVLAARNFKTVDEVRTFLFPQFSSTMENTALMDMDKLTDMLVKAIQNKLPITIYQDYDVDGCMACVVMLENLRRFGAIVNYYGNDRLVDGYGMCPNGVQQILNKYPETKIILTVDNGIVAYDGIQYANEHGLTVLVTDHHEPGKTLPPAYAVVDPKRKDESYPFRDFCGAGVALKTMFALSKKMKRDMDLIAQSVDLVALATVADVVPVIGENRIFVKQGLKLINDGVRPAFRVLNAVKNVAHVTAHNTLAFLYAPMINAVSRMGHNTDKIVEMFLSENIPSLENQVLWLDKINQDRKKETEKECKIALENLPETPKNIVIYDPSFQEGVIGIVAGRLKSQYNCPAIVFAPAEHGLMKASARSVPGLNMKETLDKMADILENYGGHPMAAGITIHQKNFAEFQKRFQALVEKDMDESKNIEIQTIDAVLKTTELSEALIRGLTILEPYGEGFKEPLIGLVANISSVRYMGSEQQHVKYTDDVANVSVITWGGGEKARKRKSFPKKFVGHLGLNEFMGHVSVQMIAE